MALYIGLSSLQRCQQKQVMIDLHNNHSESAANDGYAMMQMSDFHIRWST